MSNNLFVLQSALTDIARVKRSYLDYLNTQKFSYWSDITLPLSFFVMSLALWADKDSYPSKTSYFKKLCKRHNKLMDALNKQPPLDPEEFLKELEFFRQEYLKMFFEEAREYDWGDESLEYLIEVTGYNPELEGKEFPSEIQETLKLLKLK